MARSEGHGLVVEIQERVVVRLPLPPPSPAELEGAGDPEVARVEPDDPPPRMEDAAVAGPGAPKRDRHDVPQRRHAVASGRHASSPSAGRTNDVRGTRKRL